MRRNLFLLFCLLSPFLCVGMAHSAPPQGVSPGIVPVAPSLNMVTPEMFGAVANGSTDDHAAIKRALDSCIPVWFNGTATYNVGTAGVSTTCTHPTLYTNGAIFTFSGTPSTNATGCAFDMPKYAGITWYGGTIRTTASGTGSSTAQRVKGLCIRSQGGIFENVTVSNQASHSLGYWLPFDAGTKNSEYYNLFLNLGYDGKVGTIKGVSDNQPFLYDTGGEAGQFGPNANTWTGSGNITSYDVPPILAGSGNYLKATFQFWAAGGYALVIDNPNYTAPGVGCDFNTLGPSYFEGDHGKQNGVHITSHCRDTHVDHAFIGSLSGGIPITNDSASTYFVDGQKFDARGAASLVGSSGGATYLAHDLSYSLNGNQINGTMYISISANTLSGPVRVCGLPITWGITRSTVPGIATLLAVKNITLDPGYQWLSAQPLQGTSCMLIYENGSGKAPLQLLSRNFPGNTSIELTIGFSGLWE